MRLLVPIILIIASVGVFAVYTNPMYQGIKSLQAQSAQYNQALTQASQLRKVRDDLLAQRNAIPTDDIRSLERMLPDNVDNIRLIININDIAARDGLQISNIALNAAGSDSGTSVGTGSGPVGSVDLSFAVQATYPQFLTFLNDLEHSLRMIDIESVKFSVGNTPTTLYNLHVRTYWLR